MIGIETIQLAVAESFGLSLDELRQGSRARVVQVPRQIAMYLSKQLTNASLPEIGSYFGGRHRTSVMQSIAKVHELRAIDATLDRAICRLLAILAQPDT